MKIRLSLAALVAVATSLLAASGAGAANQSGLVNVDVSNNTVQVPIGIAANVCGVAANVLAQSTTTSPVDCTATSMAGADATASRGGGGGSNQQGLINIAIVDNTIQVPVAVAANICGVAVNLLAQQTSTGPVSCSAVGNSTATG